MHIAVMNGIVRQHKKKRNQQAMMNDEIMQQLIDSLNLVFEDFTDDGNDPTLVASVMFAVAIKQLRERLDDEEFYAILDEIRVIEHEQLNIQTETKKRTIH
jgi:hypothetical protein